MALQGRRSGPMSGGRNHVCCKHASIVFFTFCASASSLLLAPRICMGELFSQLSLP
jgi:hypothetical protein